MKRYIILAMLLGSCGTVKDQVQCTIRGHHCIHVNTDTSFNVPGTVDFTPYAIAERPATLKECPYNGIVITTSKDDNNNGRPDITDRDYRTLTICNISTKPLPIEVK